MKNRISLAVLLCTSLFLILYTFSQANSQNGQTPPQRTVRDTISIQKFNQWVGAWERQGSQYTQNVNMRYFTIPLSNFTQMAPTNPSAVRSYLGLDTTVVPAVAHLIFVGVDAAGQDMVDYQNGQYYYNFSDLCPNNCPQQ